MYRGVDQPIKEETGFRIVGSNSKDLFAPFDAKFVCLMLRLQTDVLYLHYDPSRFTVIAKPIDRLLDFPKCNYESLEVSSASLQAFRVMIQIDGKNGPCLAVAGGWHTDPIIVACVMDLACSILHSVRDIFKMTTEIEKGQCQPLHSSQVKSFSDATSTTTVSDNVGSTDKVGLTDNVGSINKSQPTIPTQSIIPVSFVSEHIETLHILLTNKLTMTTAFLLESQRWVNNLGYYCKRLQRDNETLQQQLKTTEQINTTVYQTLQNKETEIADLKAEMTIFRNMLEQKIDQGPTNNADTLQVK